MEQLQKWLAFIDKSYFERAQITLENVSYEGTSVVSKIYVMFLHKVCLFFGNVYEACLIAHFITFMIAVVIWYIALKKLFRRVSTACIVTLCIFVPLGFMLSTTLNPFVLMILLFGILLFVIISCIKALLKDKSVDNTLSLVEPDKTCQEEPVVTFVDFDEEKAIVVPAEEEKPVIFIPKSMEIPKRTSKPKLDYSLAVAEDALFYDMDVADLDDFDFPNMI